MSATSRQSHEEMLWGLHQAVVERFLGLLKQDSGEELNASMLGVIRQFLADNGITLKDAPAKMKGIEEYLAELKNLPFS